MINDLDEKAQKEFLQQCFWITTHRPRNRICKQVDNKIAEKAVCRSVFWQYDNVFWVPK